MVATTFDMQHRFRAHTRLMRRRARQVPDYVKFTLWIVGVVSALPFTVLVFGPLWAML